LNFDEVKAKGYDIRVHILTGCYFMVWIFFNLSSVVLMKCVKSWL